ncbi:MAG: hypothetical protein FWC89_13210 [Defluviitaleaceae bacterium]|nr:hypothetical protein [Defluviitaleaceae bacterium]
MNDEFENKNLNEEDDGMADLEAQFSALGIGGGDDDNDDFGDADPFASFMNFDEDDPFSQFEAMSAPAPQRKAFSLDDLDNMGDGDGGDGELDLDKQLEALLMADEQGAENFEMRDVSSALPTQSVYDPVLDGMGSVQYVKGAHAKEGNTKTKLFADVSVGAMVATFVIGILLIGAGAVTAFITITAAQAQRANVDALYRFTPIEMPVGVANNANSIFINQRGFIGRDEEREIAGKGFTLSRMTAAYTGTFFYFDEHFDPNDYYILLYNQARNLYSRTTFGIDAAPNSGTVLKFGPLSSNTLFLTLHIQCRATHEYVQFNYRFTAPVIHDVPVFITNTHPVLGSDTFAGLNIRYATFDSGSSTIHFSYSPDLESVGVRVNRDPENSDRPFVALNDRVGRTMINPLTNEDSVVFFDEYNMHIGVATFGPILNLEGTVEVVFSDLVFFYPNPEVTVTPEQLFANVETRHNPLSVQLDEFTLNLEAMVQQGPNVVLPMHVLDAGNRRRALDLNMYMRIDLGDDEFLYIAGEVHADPEGRGADVLFNVGRYSSLLRDVHISYYSLVIDYIEIEMPTMHIPVRVSQFFNMQSMRRHSAHSAVYEAFIGLLAHKSGELSPEGIVGLSPEVLRAEGLLDGMFAPASFEGRAMYSAVIPAGDMITNYDYVGVIEVLWTAGEAGPDLKYFSATFQVIAHSVDSIWSVVDIAQI